MVNNDPIIWTMLNAIKELKAEKDAEIATLMAENENALEKVSRLRGVNFMWKDASDNEYLQMGMIAQEVEEVVPEVVHTADDEMKTKAVEYEYLVGLLIEAIKKLKAENEGNKKDNVVLKDENKQLKERLSLLEARQENIETMFLAVSTSLPNEKLAKLDLLNSDEVLKSVQ